MAEDKDQRIALWRYGIIAPLLALPTERGRLKAEITRLTDRLYEHPLKGQTQLGFGTIEQWLYIYKRDGFDGLKPVLRKDQGTSRRIDDVIAEAIETLATTQPQLDGPGILDELKALHPEKLPQPSLSTLYRFLRARNLDQRRAPARQDHRAYAFDLAGDCWQSDVMYGPSLPSRDGRRRTTYLIAILDDATRLIAHAEFYHEQHLRSLKDCLKQALLKRGLPRRLYMDNGQIFRSRMLLSLAARLGIHLLHTRPYKPQGRAKLERWFGTVRRSFLTRVDLDRIDDLPALNRLLFAWIEGDYHQSAHRGLDGETPLNRWMRLSEGIRPLPRDVDLDEVFLDQTSRRVAKDGTFTLNGKVFEAGPAHIGRRIEVHFDPFDLRRVWFNSEARERLEAFPVDLAANRRLRRSPPPDGTPSLSPALLRAVDDLAKRIEKLTPPDSDKETSDDDDE